MQRRAETADSLWCSACRAMHPKSEFGKNRNSPNGFNYACDAIVSKRNASSHQKNKTQHNVRHARRRKERKVSPERMTWALKKLLADARLRARQRGCEFRLSIADLSPPDRCPVFNVVLVYQASERRLSNSASLDRIDSAGGYTPDNVWIISWRANQIKSDATAKELRQLADAVERVCPAAASHQNANIFFAPSPEEVWYGRDGRCWWYEPAPGRAV